MGFVSSRRGLVTVFVVGVVLSSLVLAPAALAARPPKGTALNVATTDLTVAMTSVTGRLIDGGRVSLFNDSTKFGNQTTGADGVVVFKGVPYGTYYVHFTHNLFCDAYYRIVVDETNTSYRLYADPKSLWEGIGY